jgi:hypothetical protein
MAGDTDFVHDRHDHFRKRGIINYAGVPYTLFSHVEDKAWGDDSTEGP